VRRGALCVDADAALVRARAAGWRVCVQQFWAGSAAAAAAAAAAAVVGRRCAVAAVAGGGNAGLCALSGTSVCCWDAMFPPHLCVCVRVRVCVCVCVCVCVSLCRPRKHMRWFAQPLLCGCCCQRWSNMQCYRTPQRQRCIVSVVTPASRAACGLQALLAARITPHPTAWPPLYHTRRAAPLKCATANAVSTRRGLQACAVDVRAALAR
jgi:hypothetical protein